MLLWTPQPQLSRVKRAKLIKPISRRPILPLGLVAIVIVALVVCSPLMGKLAAHEPFDYPSTSLRRPSGRALRASAQGKPQLGIPSPKVHPLPLSLAKWQRSEGIGDYFSQVKPTDVGYLIWSQFPVQISIEPFNLEEGEGSRKRYERWKKAIVAAIEEWNEYLPLEQVTGEGFADIMIKYAQPPWNPTFNPETGKFEIPRSRSAETSYKFYLSEDSPPILRHRMKVLVSPGMAYETTLSAIRHELGHALGIWGHSPLETDALYFSQVRDPLPVSQRDVNTLKKVYQQATSLGWKLEPRE